MEGLRTARERFFAALAPVAAARVIARGFLASIDPNDDPGAEPLGIAPVVALAWATAISVSLFWSERIPPMQDLGHHVALAAVVADYNNPKSLYPALYEPPNPLYANTLLYFVGGYLGRLVGVVTAVRACIAFYLAGVPLANLYALRVFGRSPWAAMLAVPLVYNMSYVAGFANLLFAAPFLVLLLPVFYRALMRPSAGRVLAAALLFLFTFLSHAHAYLWIGFLCFVMTLAFAAVAIARGHGARKKLAGFGKVALTAFLAVLPSLLVFALWYVRTFGAGRTEGGVTSVTGTWDDNYGAVFKSFTGSMIDIGNYTMKTLSSDLDTVGVVRLGVLVSAAAALARLQRWKHPPVMEVAFAITFASYFYLPEAISGQDVIASRQVGISLWFVPALASPVRADVSRLGRWLIIAGIVLLVRFDLHAFYDAAGSFEHDEAADASCALDAAAPRLRLHFVKLAPSTSKYFAPLWKPLWHVSKLYMGYRFGEDPDNPAINSTSPIRFRAGVDYHRITIHPPTWYLMKDLWENFDLVLVHGATSPTGVEEAKKHAVLVKKCNDWELWRTKGPWQTGEVPAWNE